MPNSLRYRSIKYTISNGSGRLPALSRCDS